LLYASLIRQFQTPAEREADGIAKGYSRILEGDLLRGEARLQELSKASTSDISPQLDSGSQELASRNSSLQSLWLNPEAELPPPKSREEGKERWRYFLAERFIHGLDEDFEYALVDDNDEYDSVERRERQEKWFEDEEPSWVDGGDKEGRKEDNDLKGETGIQDY
jgi:hypothetical protein